MSTTPSRRSRGIGRVLIAAYALLAIAATGRSVLQIVSYFDRAPVAYSFTALAALIYIVATVALIVPGTVSYRVAWVTIGFEFAFVLVVGTLTIIDTSLFPEKTVWSIYGLYYAFVPLVLPVLGMIWLFRNRGTRAIAQPAA